MPSCTLFYEFPYAIGSDPPCDIDETLCAFADAVEVELDRLDDIVDRVSDTVPVAQVRMTLTTTYPIGTSVVSFDTVDVDTAGMVNLTDNAYTITLPYAGRYLVSGHAVGNTVGAGNVVSLGVAAISFDTYLDDGSTPIYLNTAQELRYAPVGVVAVRDTFNPALTLTVGSPLVAQTFTSITFSVYWIGDLP